MRTTGRSQPTTVGTWTIAEVSSRTDCEMRMRVLSWSSLRCHSAGAGRASMERMREATIQPAVRRAQKMTAPANQAMTSQGMTSSCQVSEM